MANILHHIQSLTAADSINLRFQSEYRKIRTRKNSAFGHFLPRKSPYSVLK